jgi:DNA-binding IclR family transcriptional regulator
VSEIAKTADQALVVLQELADRGPMTPSALARSLGFNRTVTHRLLATLHGRGFVAVQNGSYAVGPVLVRLAAQVQPELRVAAAGTVTALADRIGETVVVHVPDGDDAVVLFEAVPVSNVLRVEHRVGSRHELERGASGRALLAQLRGPRVDRLIESAPNPQSLRRQLESVRQLGYAVSHDELQHGVHGLAVPIQVDDERLAGSLAVIVPSSRSSGLMEHLDELLEAAAKIAARVTGAPEPSTQP